MDAAIEIQGKLKRKDVAQYIRAIYVKTILWSVVWLVMLYLLSDILQFSIMDHSLGVILKPVSHYTIAALLAFVLLYYGASNDIAKSFFQNNKLLPETLHYKFSDEGIKIGTDAGKWIVEWNVTWNEICNVHITKHYIGLFTLEKPENFIDRFVGFCKSGRLEGYIIPRCWLEGNCNASAFDELMRLYIPSSKIETHLL